MILKRSFVFILTLLVGATGAAVPSREAIKEKISFTALKQAERITDDWDPGQRDCAGFVRFLYRSAFGSNFPQKLWRDRKGQPQNFLTADELVAWNFELLTREISSAKIQTGDVLVFFHRDKPSDDAWHMMILLDPPVRAPQRKLVIYHNGERGRKGQIRKVWLDDLIHSSEKTWRPLQTNVAFMGVYRWRGWKDIYEQKNSTLASGASAGLSRDRTRR